MCDRFTAITASRLVMLLSCTSVCAGFLPPPLPGLILFCITFGCCIGGLWTVLPAVTAFYFGSDNFLPAYKFISIFILLRCLGFPIMGISHDLTGSYALVDSIFIVLLLLAFGLTCWTPNKGERAV